MQLELQGGGGSGVAIASLLTLVIIVGDGHVGGWNGQSSASIEQVGSSTPIFFAFCALEPS